MSAFRAALVAIGATVLTAACAAGQQAQTANERPSIDATQGVIGDIALTYVAIQAPSGSSYAKGASVPLTAYITNNGDTDDALTSVTSNAFPGGWNVVSTPTATDKPTSSQPVQGSKQSIAAGSAVGFGLQNLSSSGAGSPETLVLYGNIAALFPGSTVKVTFTFADAGQTTLSVPVQVTSKPNDATLPGGDSQSAEG